MSKLWSFVKKNFLTKSFIVFCVIGVLNTVINFLIKYGVLEIFTISYRIDITTKESGFPYYLSTSTSTLVAFVLASVFSYFMNAIFTYKQKKRDSKTFFGAFLMFVLRFLLTYLFELLVYNVIMILIFRLNYSNLNETIANLIASVVMIPPFYIALGYVFKRAKKRLEEPDDEQKKNSD